VTQAPQITITGDRMSIDFKEYGEASYSMFLKAKALPEYQIACHHDDLTYTVTAPSRFAHLLDAAIVLAAASDLDLLKALLDDQSYIVKTALAAKRFAVWSDCGFGKTVISLEWARHVMHRTKGRVLAVTFKSVIPQWVEEARKFYGDTFPVAVLETREAMREWCRGEGSQAHIMFGVTNYEKFNHEGLHDQVVNELRLLAGLILDESSRLKTGAGTQKWAIIKSAKGIEYKLSCTATPAPNEPMEYSSQASFLEKLRSENEIIWTYFTKDPDTGEWSVKKHAREAFFRFMASWSIYLRNPKRYGWRLNIPDVPDPELIVHTIGTTQAQREWIGQNRRDETGNMALINTTNSNTIDRAKMAQVAKGFVYRKGESSKYDLIPSLKPAFVAQLIKKELDAGDGQVLVWTTFNAEGDLITRELAKIGYTDRAAVFSGKTPEDEREAVIQQFRCGKVPCLVSKPSLLGFGHNFQFVGSMIFSGLSDSYEAFYQAWRRAVRFGQTRQVRIHIPIIPELEGESWETIQRKKAVDEAAVADQENAYIAAMRQPGRAA
jgi:hypothetical protein